MPARMRLATSACPALGSSANLSELIMESAAGAPLATPSALNGASAFSVMPPMCWPWTVTVPVSG